METVTFGETEMRPVAQVATSGAGSSTGVPRTPVPVTMGTNQVIQVNSGAAERNYPTTAKIVIAQREKLQNGKAACIANLEDAVKAMLQLHHRQQCLFIYHGVEDELKDLVAVATAVRQHWQSTRRNPNDHRGELVVASKTAISQTIDTSKAATALKMGYSVIFVVMDWHVDMEALSTLAEAMCAIPTKGRTPSEIHQDVIALKSIAVVFVFDQAACYILSQAIQDPSKDKAFFDSSRSGGGVDDNKAANRDILEQLSQTYMMQSSSSLKRETSVFSRAWQTGMAAQKFRNMCFPSTIKKSFIRPLDFFGVFAAHNPFGPVHMIAAALLDARGEDVKQLLLSWFNYWLGTPNTFVT